LAGIGLIIYANKSGKIGPLPTNTAKSAAKNKKKKS
jgi:hypothetical protein